MIPSDDHTRQRCCVGNSIVRIFNVRIPNNNNNNFVCLGFGKFLFQLKMYLPSCTVFVGKFKYTCFILSMKTISCLPFLMIVKYFYHLSYLYLKRSVYVGQRSLSPHHCVKIYIYTTVVKVFRCVEASYL